MTRPTSPRPSRTGSTASRADAGRQSRGGAGAGPGRRGRTRRTGGAGRGGPRPGQAGRSPKNTAGPATGGSPGGCTGKGAPLASTMASIPRDSGRTERAARPGAFAREIAGGSRSRAARRAGILCRRARVIHAAARAGLLRVRRGGTRWERHEGGLPRGDRAGARRIIGAFPKHKVAVAAQAASRARAPAVHLLEADPVFGHR